MGYSKTVELPNAYTASDTVLNSNPSAVLTVSAVYEKCKSVSVVQEVYPVCTLRVKWTVVFAAGANHWSKVYVNGVAVGVEQVGLGAFSDDISLTDFTINDTIEIWGKTSGGINIQDMFVCGTASPFTKVV